MYNDEKSPVSDASSTLGWTSGVDSYPNIPSSSSTSLDDPQEDDVSAITYTYYSTWSSNYTMSNLPGPGRLLGNLYSRAGSSLERRLRKIRNRAALKKELLRAKALLDDYDTLEELILGSDVLDAEKACGALLLCARSNDHNIQSKAFESIIYLSVFFPSTFRPAIASASRRRGSDMHTVDIDTLSWKRPGVEYSSEWLYFYKLASRCLSTRWTSVVEAVAQFRYAQYYDLDFSKFEALLSSCRDSTDFLLANRFIYVHWSCKGFQSYVLRNGFADPVLLRFATAFIARCEVYFSPPKNAKLAQSIDVEIELPVRNAAHFISGMWDSLHDSKTMRELAALSEHDDDSGTQLLIWIKIFTLQNFLRSHQPLETRLLRNCPSIAKSWKDICYERLPNPEHARLRETLARLENTHGDTARWRTHQLSRARPDY